MLTFKLMTAGLGAFFLHWGIGICLIVACVLLAFFTTSIPVIGKYLGGARRDLLWAAFVIGVFLAGQGLGTYDANRRHAKQEVIVQQTVDKAVQNTTTKKFQQRLDRWDRPEY